MCPHIISALLFCSANINYSQPKWIFKCGFFPKMHLQQKKQTTRIFRRVSAYNHLYGKYFIKYHIQPHIRPSHSPSPIPASPPPCPLSRPPPPLCLRTCQIAHSSSKERYANILKLNMRRSKISKYIIRWYGKTYSNSHRQRISFVILLIVAWWFRLLWLFRGMRTKNR